MTNFGLSCFHPTSFINRYTSDLMSAPCGKCPACEIAKSSRATSNLDFIVKNSACAFSLLLPIQQNMFLSVPIGRIRTIMLVIFTNLLAT